jgi:hypothetical protein
MNQEQKFFVYTYSYPNGVPFYVGKGCGRRHKVHYFHAKAGRNLGSWNIRVIRKLLKSGQEPIIVKIADHIDEELALLVEQEFISKYGRRDIGSGILVNGTSGGDGAYDVSPQAQAQKIKGLLKAGATTRFKPGFIPWNAGKKMPDHIIELHRKAQLGTKQSEKTKLKRSLSLTGYKHKKITCPNCGSIGSVNVMNRWHFTNCAGVRNFRARATIAGKRVHLGYFATKEEADMAVAEALKTNNLAII